MTEENNVQSVAEETQTAPEPTDKQKQTDSTPEPAEAEQEPASLSENAKLAAENETPYEPGQLLEFSLGYGEGYAIVIEKIEGKDVTFRNTQEGCGSVTLSLDKAQEILESPARVR